MIRILTLEKTTSDSVTCQACRVVAQSYSLRLHARELASIHAPPNSLSAGPIRMSSDCLLFCFDSMSRWLPNRLSTSAACAGAFTLMARSIVSVVLHT